jgi:xylulokinase
MSPQRVAGIDVGTTSVKGLVIDQDARVVRTALEPLARPREAIAELDADAIVAAVEAVAGKLWPFDALAVAGMINTHLLVDERGQALTGAMTWNNQKAAEYATGGWTATSVVARVRCWSAEQPEVLARARWVMLPRDYATLRLSGQARTDSTSWPDLIEHGQLAQRVPADVRRLIPPLARPEETVAEYRGVPLIAGCMDSVAAVLGVGPTPAGTAIDVGGTSESAGVVSVSEAHRAAVRGSVLLPDGWWHAGPTQAGGRSLTWGAELLTNGDSQLFISLAEQAPHRPTGIIFLPYLEGERAPLWDPAAQAAFVGMSFANTKSDLARAVLEGVAFSVRHILDSAAPTDCAVHRLVICGRPSAVRAWNEIKADVMGLKSFVPDEPETGARGAAMLAYAGVTGLPLGEAREALAPDGHDVEPEPRNAEIYDKLFERYVALWPAIRGITRGEHPSSATVIRAVEAS